MHRQLLATCPRLEHEYVRGDVPYLPGHVELTQSAQAGFLVRDRLELGVSGFNLTDNRARQHPFGAALGARVLGSVTLRY